MTPRIYYPNTFSLNQEIRLDLKVSRHLLKSLRLKPGAFIQVFDGKGNEWTGEIKKIQRSQAIIKLNKQIDTQTESPLFIHLVYSIARFEKTDWVIQKATELGVNKITPIISEHGEVHLKEEKAIEKKLSRWQSIAVSACEQSGRAKLPDIERPIHFNNWINQPLSGLNLIFHVKDGKHLSLRAQKAPSQTINLLVGPEGGFSQREVELAKQKKFELVSLGPRTLRTETAAIIAVGLIQNLWGDMAFKG
jgi:16S rRNA (uracil1498-N3)-methyltransferase